MSNLLNRLTKTSLIGVPDVPPVGPRTYKPSIPRVGLGIAGIAMTVITIAVSVILPAQMESRSGEPQMFTVSKATAPVPTGHVTVTRIEVVSAREPESSTVPVRIAAAVPQPGRLGETTSAGVVRVYSVDH